MPSSLTVLAHMFVVPPCHRVNICIKGRHCDIGWTRILVSLWMTCFTSALTIYHLDSQSPTFPYFLILLETVGDQCLWLKLGSLWQIGRRGRRGQNRGGCRQRGQDTDEDDGAPGVLGMMTMTRRIMSRTLKTSRRPPRSSRTATKVKRTRMIITINKI